MQISAVDSNCSTATGNPAVLTPTASCIRSSFPAALAADRGTARCGRSAFRDAEGAAQAVGACRRWAAAKAALEVGNAEYQQCSGGNLDDQSHGPVLFKDCLDVCLPKISHESVQPCKIRLSSITKAAARFTANRPGPCIKSRHRAAQTLLRSGFRTRRNARIIRREFQLQEFEFVRSIVPGKFSGAQPARSTNWRWPRSRAPFSPSSGLRSARMPAMATRHDWYKAAALALRDRIVHHWLTGRKAKLRRRPQAGLLSQPGIPDRPPVHRRAEQYGAAAGIRGRARRSRRRPVRTCANASRMRRSAMAASGGSRPASWKAWRRWRFPPSATASATISACSARSSRRAGSTNIPTNGWASATPGNSSGRKWSTRCNFGGSVEHVDDQGPRPRDLASGGDRAGRRLRHADRGLARPARQRAAAVVGALARPAQARCLQHRRLSRRHRRGSARGIDLQIPLSQRRKPGGARVAAAPGIFLRLGLVAGSDQAPPRLRRAVAQPGRQGRGAAQRHPSQPRRHRTDAHPGRSA